MKILIVRKKVNHGREQKNVSNDVIKQNEQSSYRGRSTSSRHEFIAKQRVITQ